MSENEPPLYGTGKDFHHIFLEPETSKQIQHVVQSTSLSVGDYIDLLVKIDKKKEDRYRNAARSGDHI